VSSKCEFGADKTDCGARGCGVGRRLSHLPTAPVYDKPGHLEIWVSRSLALYGTRAATIDTSAMEGREITVRLTEGDETLADGRYVYLRSFDSDRRLRIDGLELFALPETTPQPVRRLEEEERAQQPTPQPVDGADRFSWGRVWVMRNLTADVCANATDWPQQARDSRVGAAQLWAELGERESLVGCVSCATGVPGNCTAWFTQLHGLKSDFESVEEARARKKRRIMEEVKARSDERIRIMREALGKSCCKVNLKTGHKQCGEHYCKRAFKSKADARMAHTLRRMHEREGPTELNVPQLVATDMLAPHLHADERCRDVHKRQRHGDMECLASSLTSHLAKKHGLDATSLDDKLSVYGTSIASMLTAHLEHHADPKTREERTAKYRSDPRAAEEGASRRRARARRRAEEREAPTAPQRPKPRGPRGGWVARSSVDGRMLSEDDGNGNVLVRVGVEPTGRTDLMQRHVDAAVRNHSLHAKAILRKANLGAANMGGKGLTAGRILGSAWDASISTDGSLVGRTRTVLSGAARIADRVQEFRDEYNARAAAPPATPWAGRRQLHGHEHDAYDAIDRRVGRTDVGLSVPEAHLRDWGWIAESVDWATHFAEAKRVARVLEDRHDAMYAHAASTGTLPSGSVRDEHVTGLDWLDVNVPPSRMGEWLRGLRHISSNGRQRRLGEGHRQALYDMPRAGVEDAAGDAPRSVLGSMVDAAVGGGDAFAAGWNALQRNEHRTRARRLSDGFLGGAVEFVAPVSTGVTTLGSWPEPLSFANQVPVQPTNTFGLPIGQTEDSVTSFVRYIVYDVGMCYLYDPPGASTNEADPNFGDGTGMQVHYSDRMCFPMVPFAPARMGTFNELFSLPEDYDWDTLEYKELCDSGTVRALIGPMMGGLSAVGFIAAPYGSMLRIAEGIDSIRNLAGANLDAGYTESDRAASVVCGFAQFGGVLWLAVTLVFLSIFATCSGVCGTFCVRCTRFWRGGNRRMRAYEDAIHEVLLANIDAGRLADPVGLRQLRFKGALTQRRKLRGLRTRVDVAGTLVRPRGHTLLPQEP